MFYTREKNFLFSLFLQLFKLFRIQKIYIFKIQDYLTKFNERAIIFTTCLVKCDCKDNNTD